MPTPEPIPARAILLGLLTILFFLTCLDHGLRLDQKHECERGDEVRCPERLWWFVPSGS